MFDHIGAKTRTAVFDNLPWISRSAGLVEPVPGAEGRIYPGARPFDGQPCDAGDYVNMSPSETETCIAFVDMDSEIRRTRNTSRFYDFELFFRVVLWYDERKISIDAGNFLFGIQSAIAAGVQAAQYDTTGIHRTKVTYNSTQLDALKVWERYNIDQAKQGLFLLPYRSLAIRFRMIGMVTPACFAETITANPAAC